MSITIPPTQDNTTQILTDIESLQKVEQEMFSNLEENPNLTPEQQNEMIQKINQISQMRVNLYQTLGTLSQTYGNMLTNSNEIMNEQTRTISIVEQELNQSKQKLQTMEEEKNNQVRLIEINNYYSQKYSNHTKIFQIILWMLVLLILIVWLRNNAYLPGWAFTGLFFLIIVFGLWNLLPALYYTWLRDNMNYQEYYWKFDASTAPKPDTKANDKDPWAPTKSNDLSSICQGQACCDDFSTYDASLNICVPNGKTCPTTNNGVLLNNANSSNLYTRLSDDFTRGINNASTGLIRGVSTVSNNLSSTIYGMTNYPESFENNTNSSNSNPIMDALTKPERENRYKKPDVTLGYSPQATSGQSFVQFNGF